MRIESPELPDSYTFDELEHLDVHEELKAILNWNHFRLEAGPNPSPLISPLSFYDKHLDDSLALKRITVLPSLLSDLSSTVDLALDSLDDLPPFCPAFPSAMARKIREGRDNPVVGAMSLAEIYQSTTAKYCGTIASTLSITARLSAWSTFLVWRIDKNLDALWKYDTVCGSLHIDPIRLSKLDSLDSVHPLWDSKEYSMLDVFKSLRKLGTWMIHTMSDEADRLFREMDGVASNSFIGQTCLTKGSLCGPRISFDTFDAQKSCWSIVTATRRPDGPWRNTRARKARAPLNDSQGSVNMRKKAVTRSLTSASLRQKSAVPAIQTPTQSVADERRKREHGHPTAADLVQHAWAEAVREDTTIVVFNCGNFERIGIRHRKTQTLYLSTLIKTDSCRHPAYGKLQIGLYIAAIEDAVDRTLQQLSSKGAADEDKKPDGIARRNRKRRRLNVAPWVGSDISHIVEQTQDRQLAVIHLRYDIYNSPAPASFLRHNATTSSNKQSYQPHEYMNIIITSHIGYGATGVLHGAKLELETADGQHLTHDVVVKLAFSAEQRKRMKREYDVYCHLAAANVKGIMRIFGLFQDMEGHTLALIMTNGGISLTDRHERAEVRRRGPRLEIPPNERTAFLRILEDIHATGVRHRDLRGHNLLVDPDSGEVSIIDFDRALMNSSEEAIREEYEFFTLVLDGEAVQQSVSLSPFSSSRLRYSQGVYIPDSSGDDDRVAMTSEDESG